MVRIPIEIIEYILDWVDLRAALAFSLCMQTGSALHNYIQGRIKSAYSESIELISKIKYEIWEGPYIAVTSSFRDGVNYSYRREPIYYYGRKDLIHQHKRGEFLQIGRIKMGGYCNVKCGVSYTSNRPGHRLPRKGERYDYCNVVLIDSYSCEHNYDVVIYNTNFPQN